MKRWLHTYTPHIRHCCTLAQKHRRKSTGNIRAYIHTQPSTNHTNPRPQYNDRKDQQARPHNQSTEHLQQSTVLQFFTPIDPPTDNPTDTPINTHIENNSQQLQQPPDSSSTTSTVASPSSLTQDDSTIHPEIDPRPLQTSLTKYFNYADINVNT